MKTNVFNLAVINLSGLLVLTAAGQAQPTNSLPELSRDQAALRPQYSRCDRLADALQLRGERRDQAKPILEKFIGARDALFAKAALSHDEKAAQVRQLRLETGDRLKPILTPDQYGKWISLLDAIPRPAN